MDEYKSSSEKNENTLEKIKDLDNTIPEYYLYKLQKNNDDIKLKERSFDILKKDELKKFGINKTINFRELYFEIIEYIESIIIDEPEKAEKGFDYEEFIGSENGKNTEKPESENKEQTNNKFEEEKNEIIENKKEAENKIDLNVEIEEKNDLDEDLSDSEFKKVFEKKENFKIEGLLIKDEKIKVEDIKKKFKAIFEACFSFSDFKKNYPDFESEFFYFNCIRYMLETYKELKYKRFIKKLLLTKKMEEITNIIKDGHTKDNLIKILYYYIMNTQYHLKQKYLYAFSQYKDGNSDFSENNDFIIHNNNLCSKKNNKEIILENVDDYFINDIIEKKILFKLNKNILIQNYYSIKGLLKHSKFTKEDGDKFWEEFLNSKILNDIVQILYNQVNIFNQKEVINLYKERSYYFPNFNKSFLALSHKELFNIYFPYSKVNLPSDSLKGSCIIKMINKAVNKVEIQHEWGHTSSSFLFLHLKLNILKLQKGKLKSRKNPKIKKAK